METHRHLTTEYHWADLILNESSLQLMNELNETAKQQQPCHALFYGSSGTGKTLAAALLGKELQKDVVRVDLSTVVSKYIGETEKNLEQLFLRAETKDWILFFDEADALFGKRTEIKDSHDRYSNLEIAYLLQRLEQHPGIVLFATNKKTNIDDAFIRRLRYDIHFPIPAPPERLRLWEKGLNKNNLPISTVDLHTIAHEFELSGAVIMNVTQQLRKDAAGKNNSINNDLIIHKIKNWTTQ